MIFAYYIYLMKNATNTCSRILAINLRYFRTLRGSTQLEIATTTGIAIRTYHALESGKANPTLQTLELLAQFYGVMVQCFLTLTTIRLETNEIEFLQRIKATFIEQEMAFMIRSFDLVALWGNYSISKVLNHDLTISPLYLSERISPLAQKILLEQIYSEKDGIIKPYLNTFVSQNGESSLYRFYPTVIFPNRGSKPLYSIIYMVSPLNDLNEAYYRYCHLLLNCL